MTIAMLLRNASTAALRAHERRNPRTPARAP
jgi:5,10-methylene-tetrahydrofolate dehydrogenase/methenyl tetrahydrofolate cyclohydrolase